MYKSHFWFNPCGRD